MGFWDLTCVDVIDSTNEEVKRAIEAGASEGFAVRAARQTGGYGRQGRSWTSPAGGMYESFLLQPRTDTRNLPTLALVAGLAVRAAVEAVRGAEGASPIQVKWPNDVVCAQGKLSGMTAEVHRGSICVGIGVNVFPPQEAVSVGGKNTPAYLADMLSGPAPENLVDIVGDEVLAQFHKRYAVWCDQGFAPFLEEYNRFMALRGALVNVQNLTSNTLAAGRVCGVDVDGRLLLDEKGQKRAVSSGEVHILGLV